jgi:GTP pyrophosphokinase
MEMFTNWHTWQQAEPELRRLLPAATCDVVARAVSFAAHRHGDQRRPTGAPYLEHLLEALEVLVRGAGVTDKDVLAAAVLHDVVEDTPATVDDVRAGFGDEVAALVGWVTIPDTPEGADRAAHKEAHLAKLGTAPDNAVLVKLADRTSNVQTLRNLSPDRQRSYYAQTVRYIMPLAQSLETPRRNWFRDWYARWQEAHQDLA